MLDEISPVDIVIDDGSHMVEHVLTSFNVIFPRMSPNGIYAVEDTRTSYLNRYGGDSENLNNPTSTLGFFKSLVDNLNYQFIENDQIGNSFFQNDLSSLHFYKELVIIKKT